MVFLRPPTPPLPPSQHPIGVEKKQLKRPGRPQVTVSKDAVERLKYHTLRDAADVLGVCPNTVRKLRQAHNVPTKQVVSTPLPELALTLPRHFRKA